MHTATRSSAVLASALFLLLQAGAPAQASHLVGDRFLHRVEPGDTLRSLSARYAVDAGLLARINGLPRGSALNPGDELEVDNRHLVAGWMENGVLVNIPQRMLFLFRDGELKAHYPVGLGRRGWATPPGQYRIVKKEVDPSWEVPRSIQREMRRKGRRVVKRMPPGPENPLGSRWLGLNKGALGIHGTPATSSLFGFVSHGCIRMHPDDVEELFDEVEVGTTVHVIYRPVTLARGPDGDVLLEVHPDVYRKGGDPLRAVRQQAEREGLQGSLDWHAVRQAVADRAGVAVVVGRHGDAETADAN